ncbi:LLM class flavin-dependent oxidoreductase [Agromyces sp. MMS24-K17]|uniref:LLM class flavin-dependent oxidoreductase n=1 Tax=Agromyces sp. MMS24-K17 TaxID=3372850 RepID=UPI003753FD86
MTKNERQLKLGLAAYGTGWDLDAWRLPDATNAGLEDPRVIADLAVTAERGLFDYVFVGSALASEPTRLNRVFRWDSAVYAGHAAARTSHVGFLVTYNSSYEHPYFVARQLATLDRFSAGRAALNVVSGVDREGGPTANFGRYPVADEESKYRRAAEFTEAVYRLLYESWDRDYLLDDRAAGTLVRPGSWHEVDISGEFFDIRGPLNVAPPVQARIPNVHVGLSEASLDYGARYAQARFSPYFGTDAGQEHYAAQKRRVAAAGGDPERFLVLPGVTFYLAGTAREARAKHREILDLELTEQLPASFAAAFGLQPEEVAPDARLRDAVEAGGLTLEQIKPALDALEVGGGRRGAPWLRETLADALDDGDLTFAEFFRFIQKHREGQGIFVGDPAGFADWITDRFTGRVFDGLQLFPPYHRGPADFLVDHVVPELQRRGVFRREYESSVLEVNLGLRDRDEADPGDREGLDLRDREEAAA